MPYKITGQILVNGHWEPISDDDLQISFSDIESSKDGDWEEIEHCQGSDYSGSSVTRANYREIKKMLEFGELSDLDVKLLYGGYDSYGILYRISAYESAPDYRNYSDDETIQKYADENKLTFEESGKRLEQSYNLASLINGLVDYPCVSDEAVSELEHEWISEAWDSWAESDFRSELIKVFLAENSEQAENWLDWLESQIENIPSDALYSLFHNLAERANEYWESQHADMYIGIDEIVKEATWDDLITVLPLPMCLSGHMEPHSARKSSRDPLFGLVPHASLKRGLLPPVALVGHVSPGSFEPSEIV